MRSHHGHTVEDPYEWLRDKDNPEVIAHLEAENDYTNAMTSHLNDLQDTIFDEIKDRTQQTDLSVPTRRGLWWYYADDRGSAVPHLTPPSVAVSSRGTPPCTWNGTVA